MAIEYYVGTDGPTIVVESSDDLYEALDTLHTQVIDNISEEGGRRKMLSILEYALSRLEDECGVDPS